MKNKKFLLSFFLVLINYLLASQLQSNQVQYTEIMPYIPDGFTESKGSKTLLIKLMYNYNMHNIEDAIKLFEEANDIADSKELQEYYSGLSDFSSDFFYKLQSHRVFIIRTLESLMLMGENDRIHTELENWYKIIDISKDESELLRFQLFKMYFFLKTNQEDKFQRLEKFIDIEKITQDILSNKSKYINSDIVDQIKYLAKLYNEYYRNSDMALKLLYISFTGFYQQQTVLERAYILADNDIKDAIKLIETELDIFFKNEYSNPMQSYSNNIERSRMFLSYLYYIIGNKDKALENFQLAVTSKKNGSTFMGDWEYWLDYRNYFKNEHEVLLELKDIYLSKEKD